MADLEAGQVLAPVDAAAVLAAHVRWHDDNGTCSYCGSSYPCAARRLAEELTAARAGADPTPVPEGVYPTPAQAWHRLLAATAAERAQILGHAIEAAERALVCTLANHVGQLAQAETGAAHHHAEAARYYAAWRSARRRARELAHELEPWRCECGDINGKHEWSCYRCGAVAPEPDGLDLASEALGGEG